jgi:hypothetical protein
VEDGRRYAFNHTAGDRDSNQILADYSLRSLTIIAAPKIHTSNEKCM